MKSIYSAVGVVVASFFAIGIAHAQIMSDDGCGAMPTTVKGYSTYCPKPRSYYEDLRNKKIEKLEAQRKVGEEQSRALGKKLAEERDAQNLAIAKSKGFNSYEDYQKAENLKLAKSNGYNSYEEYQKAQNEIIQKQMQKEAADVNVLVQVREREKLIRIV